MPFTPEEIEALSPTAREEVQGWIAVKYLAQRDPATPERRRSMRLKFRKKDWPHAWHSRHDDPIEEHLKKMDRHAWAALHLRTGSKEANGG